MNSIKLNFLLIMFAIVLSSCNFSDKPVINIHLAKNQCGWCCILLDSSSNVNYQKEISVRLNLEYNAVCVNNKFKISDKFNIYNYKDELITNKVMNTTYATFPDGSGRIHFYVPSKKEMKKPASYWDQDRVMYRLIDEELKIMNLPEEAICSSSKLMN